MMTEVGVDEEGLFVAFAKVAFGVGGFVFREGPEATWDLCAVEDLAGERAQVLGSISAHVLHCIPLGTPI